MDRSFSRVGNKRRPTKNIFTIMGFSAISLLVIAAPAQAQLGQAIALAAPIAPLNAITVPDVNVLGLLDRTGPGAGAWPQITNQGQQTRLQQMGKALFWDMQVGGDGIQSCATCHYHAGADNRRTNQMSPGLKMTTGGVDPALAANFNPDFVHDLLAPNAALTLNQYVPAGNPNRGFPVSEAELAPPPSGIGNWTADAADGTPGTVGAKGNPLLDVNDVASSQGVRFSEYFDLSGGRVDTATLEPDDPGFNLTLGTFTTVRRVEPRNSPTAINAVYHLRNFWDGRADLFFNGVNPLGFRDPDARVKTYVGGAIVGEKLRIPFSSLASQAVGPIESVMEMVGHVAGDAGTGRPHRELGRKLLNGAQPLSGQEVLTTDSLLGSLRDVSGRGLAIPDNAYDIMIREIFDERFWGDGSGNDVCLDADGNLLGTAPVDTCLITHFATAYTLMEWNFSMFFGLAVQAYEAMLTTEQTIVDLLVGGIATGQVVNTIPGRRGQTVTVPVTGLPLEGCIAAASLGNSPAARGVATALCTQHYSQFIHPKAVAGAEAGQTAFPVAPGTAIGGCLNPADIDLTTTATNGVVEPRCQPATLAAARSSLLSIERGIGRFFAGATGCGICHFNPEFTGATVSALTGFGAAPLPPLPPGQLRRIPLEVPMERMIAFNGAAAVYDAGFYNIGVRPTPEDLSLGEQIGGVPLAFTKLSELIALLPGPLPSPYDAAKISAIAAELASLNDLLIPTAPLDLTPRPFTLALACGPGLVGNGGGDPNNNPNPQCVPNIIPGERLLRNGAFKAQGLRNVKFTGPYLHNGAKLNLRQVVEFYKTAGHFVNLNFNNLDAGMRIFNLGVQDEAALVEMMETGLTDWRVAYEEGQFDHPEICVPHGHDPVTGETILVGIPAVGSTGSANPLQTFEEQVRNITAARTHTLTDPCNVVDDIVGPISVTGLSMIDVPPAP